MAIYKVWGASTNISCSNEDDIIFNYPYNSVTSTRIDGQGGTDTVSLVKGTLSDYSITTRSDGSTVLHAVFPYQSVNTTLVNCEILRYTDANGHLVYVNIPSNGNNTLTGTSGNNVLNGYAGNDTLDGGLGNDTIVGGLGRDILTGGGGKDIFDFNLARETGLTSTTRDVISDFTRGQDKIDLSTIDANTGLIGNQTFSAPLVGGAFAGTFTGPGKLYFDTAAHVLYGNTDSDNAAEFSIRLTAITTLSTTDFIL